MTLSADLLMNSAIILAFNAGGFYYVARTWKKAVNGHLDKLDVIAGEIQTDIAKTREEVSEIRGYCRARTLGNGCE